MKSTNGRYEITWPSKEENHQLADNYQLALDRVNSLLKRVQGYQELLQRYEGIIQNQLNNEIAEKVNDKTEDVL